MNIKDFLIDNYIWILAIILITIITIIGFIADKKKNNKKSDNSIPQQPITPIEPINNQPINIQPMTQQMFQPQNIQEPNIGIEPNYNNNTNTIPMPSNVEQISQPENMQTTLLNNTNNQMPIENNEVTQPYQPLSEQKPVFAPQQPMLNAETLNNTQPTMVNNSFESPMPTMMSPQQPIDNINQMPSIQPDTQPYSAIPQQMMPNNNNMMMPNTNQINNQSPMNQQYTVPTPVMPQQIMPTYNQNLQMQPNMIPQQPMPQNPQTNQFGEQSTPMNFVFGPQNNNQNMQ